MYKVLKELFYFLLNVEEKEEGVLSNDKTIAILNSAFQNAIKNPMNDEENVRFLTLCMYMCVYVCMYAFMFVCFYVYIHTNIRYALCTALLYRRLSYV